MATAAPAAMVVQLEMTSGLAGMASAATSVGLKVVVPAATMALPSARTEKRLPSSASLPGRETLQGRMGFDARPSTTPAVPVAGAAGAARLIAMLLIVEFLLSSQVQSVPTSVIRDISCMHERILFFGGGNKRYHPAFGF